MLRCSIFQNLDLYTTVVLTAFFGVVGVDRLRLAAAFCLDALRCDTTLDEVFLHGIGTAVRQLLVRRVLTYVISVTDNADAYFRVARQVHIEVLQCLLGTREDARLVRREMEVLHNEYLAFLNRRQSDIHRIADKRDWHVEGIVTYLRNVNSVLRTFFQHLTGRSGRRIGS